MTSNNIVVFAILDVNNILSKKRKEKFVQILF